MTQIATYVFLDLETTSIPRAENNKTRIVELSMVVVKRRHLLETRAGTMPRVQQRLTMCFNPGRAIDPGATEVTGLDNFLVEYETPFNIKVFNTINSFLECLEKPVCLIAENGHLFDFPILKNHFERLKVQLAEDILCADSLYAFYDILKALNISDVDGSYSSESAVKPDDTVIQDKPDEVPSEHTHSDNNNECTNLTKDEAEDGGDENNDRDTTLNSQLCMQLQNEMTPKSNKFKITPAKRISEARRKLFYVGCEKPKLKFKLKNIYERVLGRPGNDAHRAENDCLMAAEIAVAKSTDFVDWVDKNHCAFSEVKPMRPGVPVGY